MSVFFAREQRDKRWMDGWMRLKERKGEGRRDIKT